MWLMDDETLLCILLAIKIVLGIIFFCFVCSECTKEEGQEEEEEGVPNIRPFLYYSSG